MSTHRQPQPSFLWQGILIVLPAAVLAIFGLFALRQDRLLAHEQAAEQARKIVNDAAQAVLPAALEVNPPEAVQFNRSGSLPAAPAEDVVFDWANRSPGWVVCLVDQRGDLLFPLPDTPPVPSAHSGTPELDPHTRAAWNKAQASEFEEDGTAKAIGEYERFLAGTVPKALLPQANYRLAVLLAKSGQVQAARDRFCRVQREYPSAPAETGVPLALYAGLHLLELPVEPPDSSESPRHLLDSTCAQAVFQFPMLAEALLDRLGGGLAIDQTKLALWRGVLQAHEWARRIQATWQRATRNEHAVGTTGAAARWIELGGGEPWLVLAAPSGPNTCLMALPEASTVQWLENSLLRLALSNYLGVELRVAGRLLIASHGEELAAATLPGSANRPGVDITVRLLRPELLYARQRARTYWFGGLIGLSAMTMLIGFLAAWRAFRHQQELSEMRRNFVSSVSHELRAPIASVRLMAEELEDMPEPATDKSRSYHSFIVQECRRLSALIENVLDFSRHEQGRKEYQFEPTDLAALIEATAKLMRTYAAGKQISINTSLPPEPFEIEVDGRALQQVLVNLVDNAIKHSPPDSVITVGLEHVPAVGPGSPPQNTGIWEWLQARLRWRAPFPGGPAVRLWVEDHGEGIPLEEQAKIFQRFYRPGSELRRESQGVGLGLAIVKYVAEAHGGQVSVCSAVGQGSRFTVQLPLRIPPGCSNDTGQA